MHTTIFGRLTAMLALVLAATVAVSAPAQAETSAPMTVTGVVRDGVGTPLAGAEVVLGQQVAPGAISGPTTQSARDGSFSVTVETDWDGSTPSSFILRATRTGYLADTTSVNTAPGQTVVKDLRLHQLPTVHGTVTTKNRRPVAGATVEIHANVTCYYGQCSHPVVGTTTTAADGTYTVAVDPSRWNDAFWSTIDVRVVPAGYQAVEQSFDFTVTGPDITYDAVCLRLRKHSKPA